MMTEISEMENAEEELWASIPGHEGLYSVSTFGRVRRDAGGRGSKPGYIFKPRKLKAGHLYVNLRKNGKSRRMLVHRLVLLAFVGPCPSSMEVCHKDGNPLNNLLDNLRYDTRTENILDCHRYGGRTNNQKLTLTQVAEVRERLRTGERCVSIAQDYGVCKATISHIKNGRNWKHRLDQTLAA